jgi:hypothetical protein
MSIPKRERLQELYRRLAAAPDAATFEEAFNQLSSILNEIENDWSLAPYDPENWRNDGRLYPPLLDNVRDVDGHPGLKRLRSRFHNTFIAANGAIEIQKLGGEVEFTKAGADGRGVWDRA